MIAYYLEIKVWVVLELRQILLHTAAIFVQFKFQFRISPEFNRNRKLPKVSTQQVDKLRKPESANWKKRWGKGARWPSRNEFPLLLLGYQYKKCCLKTDESWVFIFQAKYLHNYANFSPKFIRLLSSWRICTLLKGTLIARIMLKAAKFN